MTVPRRRLRGAGGATGAVARLSVRYRYLSPYSSPHLATDATVSQVPSFERWS